MKLINEEEFARICKGLYEDRETIYKHNPIGTQEETLLWMLLSILISYLSLTEQETPCFTGLPTAETYRTAIEFILQNKAEPKFDADKYFEELKS